MGSAKVPAARPRSRAGSARPPSGPGTYAEAAQRRLRLRAPLGTVVILTALIWLVPSAGGRTLVGPARGPGPARLASFLVKNAAHRAGVDGTGSMTVPPVPAAPSRSTTLVFTYTADAAQGLTGGEVTLTVPPGWTQPSTASGAPGQVTASCPPGCVPSVSNMMITLSRVALAPRQSLTITYATAIAPRTP